MEEKIKGKSGPKFAKGRKAYNNGQKVIYLKDGQDIPEGFIKGGLANRSKEAYKESGRKSSETQKLSWQNKSKEEKDLWSEKCRAAQLNMDLEVRAKHTLDMINTNHSKPIEEQLKINQRRRESCINFWKQLTSDEHKSKLDFKLEKTRETCLERYGVEYPCMREEARASGNNSKPNQEFADLLTSNNILFSREKVIGSFQYDFQVNKTLIEINPSITHNSTFSPFGKEPIDKNYHYNKTLLAKENNYRCIQIFDWDNKDKIISILKNRPRVYARDCIIKEVDKIVAAQYINKYHLQGYARDNIRLGLYYKDELVEIMTFGKPRYNKKYEYELIRLCGHYQVVGGAEKLFKHFLITYNPSSIISYCDFSKFNGDIYNRLGFSYDHTSVGKHWYNMKTHEHITDNLLRQRGFDQLFKTNYGKGTSNEELMLEAGFIEIYDAGQGIYTYINKDV